MKQEAHASTRSEGGSSSLLAILSSLHNLTIPILDSFVFLFGGMDALFQPAYSAARAQVFTEDIRNAANALTQMSQQAARLLGPAVDGVRVWICSVRMPCFQLETFSPAG